MDNERALELKTLVGPRLQPARDFLHALQKLGLDPDALFWAFDTREDDFVLVLVTSFFDYVGPLEISKSLFAAYNSAVTPREIDPFIIRLHSPSQSIARSFKNIVKNIEKKAITGPNGVQVPLLSASYFVNADLEIPVDGLVKFSSKPMAREQVSRKWSRYTANIDRLAA